MVTPDHRPCAIHPHQTRGLGVYRENRHWQNHGFDAIGRDTQVVLAQQYHCPWEIVGTRTEWRVLLEKLQKRKQVTQPQSVPSVLPRAGHAQ